MPRAVSGRHRPLLAAAQYSPVCTASTLVRLSSCYLMYLQETSSPEEFHLLVAFQGFGTGARVSRHCLRRRRQPPLATVRYRGVVSRSH